MLFKVEIFIFLNLCNFIKKKNNKRNSNLKS